jgi:sugar phosphate isomerase/epimerase
MGLDFIDLTLEPPHAASWKVDREAIRRALERHRLDIVGHTAFYLPIASGIEEIRRAAVEELRRCVDVFAAVGARWMNVHPDRHVPMHDRRFFIERNLASLGELLPYASERGVGLMVENLPGDFNTAQDLGELLDPLPELGLHLDIGHANLLVARSTVEELLSAYGARLRHVHLHDNKGGSADLHLPLGTGTVDLSGAVRLLKLLGYDGTITLEVFAPDRHHLAYSRDLLQRAWDDDGRG